MSAKNSAPHLEQSQSVASLSFSLDPKQLSVAGHSKRDFSNLAENFEISGKCHYFTQYIGSMNNKDMIFDKIGHMHC